MTRRLKLLKIKFELSKKNAYFADQIRFFGEIDY